MSRPLATVLALAALSAACVDAPTAAAPTFAASLGAPGRGGPPALGRSPRVDAIAVSPSQDVVVELGDGSRVPGRFQSTFQIMSVGRDHGHARLEYALPGGGPTSARVRLRVELTAAELVASDAGPVVRFTGRGELCVGPGGGCRELPITGTVRPDAVHTGDCLIYDFVGPNVHLVFEAEGRLIRPGGA
jgi:hypothetical protein